MRDLTSTKSKKVPGIGNFFLKLFDNIQHLVVCFLLVQFCKNYFSFLQLFRFIMIPIIEAATKTAANTCETAIVVPGIHN